MWMNRRYGLLSIRVLAVKYQGGEKRLLKLKRNIGSRKNGNKLTISTTDKKIYFFFLKLRDRKFQSGFQEKKWAKSYLFLRWSSVYWRVLCDLIGRELAWICKFFLGFLSENMCCYFKVKKPAKSSFTQFFKMYNIITLKKQLHFESIRVAKPSINCFNSFILKKKKIFFKGH